MPDHTRAIADKLNEEGWPAKRRSGFTREMVNDLLRTTRIGQPPADWPRADHVERQANEMTILELAQHLGMPHQTLFTWVRTGKVQGRLSKPSGYRAWLITVDDAELERLKALRERSSLCKPFPSSDP